MSAFLKIALPTVSVVIPTYNYGRFVRVAVESALRQSYAPLEVIVVDDGSTDDTAQLLWPYLRRINYIYQKNQGLSAARNTGIRAAHGDWVALLDSDDCWEKDKLLHQMRCATAFPEVCVMGALEKEICKSSDANIPQEGFSIFKTWDLLGGLPFGASSVVAKRQFLLDAGLFDERRRSVEDRDMWLRLSTMGAGGRVNLPLWTYRVHPQQMTANPDRMCENYACVLEDFFKNYPQKFSYRAFASAYFHYDASLSYHEAGMKWDAVKHAIQSILRFPFPLRKGKGEKRFNRMGALLKAFFGPRVVASGQRVRHSLASALRFNTWL